MKYVKDNEYEYVETGEVNLTGENIVVTNAGAYNNFDIGITAGLMTWSQLDKLKEAIDEAERRWRGKTTILPPFHHS